jgi:UDP-N-acetyl-D-glucosamine dehydrogenase
MKIAIIGLGYVGLPLSLQFARSCTDVVGIDVDPDKVEAINKGRSYINHVSEAGICEMVNQGKFGATTDFSRIREVEAVIICVPTPLNKNREPDLSFVLDTGRMIAPYLELGRDDLKMGEGRSEMEDGRLGTELPTSNAQLQRLSRAGSPTKKLVVLESTTYPGTTEEDLREVLEKGSGLKAGVDFHLAFSPEREDPANELSKVKQIPKVVGGYTPACLERAVALYEIAIDTVVPVSSCRAAEATKLLENIFRSVNIALVNELKIVYEAMGIDIWEVIEAAKTKPFGFMPFYPGPGLGGHCIPIDPFYLTWKAREYGRHTRFIELAGEINTAMPEHVVHRVADALNARQKSLKGSRVLIIGLAYKPDVDDERESPSYVLMTLLTERGARVEYYDLYVPVIKPTREHSQFVGKKSVEWQRATIEGFDLVLIATNHSSVNYTELGAWAQCIVDTRNAMAGIAVKSGKVWKA